MHIKSKFIGFLCKVTIQFSKICQILRIRFIFFTGFRTSLLWRIKTAFEPSFSTSFTRIIVQIVALNFRLLTITASLRVFNFNSSR
ncbi:hypothetical protein C2G38_2072050 [Gigaspora rosea]|uniref:Uncharacterized protein n=1 Tax=Gigaspora rosea TaxID=44941 RepID=A0A397VPL3_9GLOM|nr:hypothetical protein C2G38_2072050 [Gigaspora rosea]